MAKDGSAQAKPGAHATAAFDLYQARVVAVCKAIEYLTMGAFAIVVPRLMGPVLYGQFALLLGFISLLTMAFGFGVLSTFARFVPIYRVRDTMAKVGVLFMQVLLLRMALLAALAGPLTLALTLLLPEASPVTIAATIAAMGLSVVGATFYELLHGLNALGKWLLPNAIGAGVLLLLILLLGGATRLEAAAIALLAVRAAFFVLGVYWTQNFLTWTRSVLDWRFLYEHLRFGVLLFLGGFLLLAVLRSGDVVVGTFSGDPRQIAYFSLANLVMVTQYALIGQLSRSIIPTLTMLHASGKDREVRQWLGDSLKYLAVLASVFLLLVLGAGRWMAALAWGEEFHAVADILMVLSVGLLMAPVIAITVALAIVYNRPEKIIPLSGGGLLAFLALSALLVPAWGALGASVAVTLGLAVAALLACCTFWRLGFSEALSSSRFVRQTAVLLASLSVFALPGRSPILLGAIGLALYLGLLFLARVLQREDVRRAARLLGAK